MTHGKPPEMTVTVRHLRVIRSRLAVLEWSVRALARRAGLGRSTLYKILGGRQMTSAHLPKILEVLGVAADSDPAALDAVLERDAELMAARLDLANGADALAETQDADRMHTAAKVLDALARTHEPETPT